MLIWLPSRNQWTRILTRTDGWVKLKWLILLRWINWWTRLITWSWLVLVPDNFQSHVSSKSFFTLVWSNFIINHLWNTRRQDSGTHLLAMAKSRIKLSICWSLVFSAFDDSRFKLQQSSSYLRIMQNTGFATRHFPMESSLKFCRLQFYTPKRGRGRCNCQFHRSIYRIVVVYKITKRINFPKNRLPVLPSF